jgi:hypothetical protein
MTSLRLDCCENQGPPGILLLMRLWQLLLWVLHILLVAVADFLLMRLMVLFCFCVFLSVMGPTHTDVHRSSCTNLNGITKGCAGAMHLKPSDLLS